MRNAVTLLSLSCIAFGLAGHTALASDTPAVTFSGPGNIISVSQWVTDGWSFTVDSTTIEVTSLGYYDVNGDGLTASHPVGIWDLSGTLLVATTVMPSDALAPDSFRYVTISSLSLSLGTYTIGALRGPSDDQIASDVPDFSVAPGLSYLRPRFVFGTSLAQPINSAGATTGGFGPNFRFSPIPEPTTLALLGLGSLALVTVRRRR